MKIIIITTPKNHTGMVQLTERIHVDRGDIIILKQSDEDDEVRLTVQQETDGPLQEIRFITAK
jgi:hypothetical protein